MNDLKKTFLKYFPCIIFILLVIASYFPTFTGGFILDDNPLIKNNDFIKEPHSISSYLSQEDGVTGQEGVGSFHTGYYRPLINLTYRIDYQIWGMNAPGFRATNLILHILCCLLLFRLIQSLMANKEAAFWITIIFALHPVNTESVSWVISRNNILVTFFILLSFHSYIIWWEKGKIFFGLVSMICFMGALLSKEFGLVLLVILFLYHRLLSGIKRNILLELVSYIPFLLLLMLYLGLRQNVTGAFLSPFDNARSWSNIYFIPYIIIWNLKLIFSPYKLHYFYVDYPSSLMQWQPVLSIVLFILFLIMFWIYRRNRILMFAGVSFLAFLLPVLNLIPSASTLLTLVAMRWLYLPMAFLFIGLAIFISKGLARWKQLTISILIVFIAYFGIYTHVLNKNLWHDEAIFFEQEVLSFNNDFFAGDLAEVLLKNGDYEGAEKYFYIAVDKYPFQAYHFINYSALLIDTSRPHEAIVRLNEARSLPMTGHEMGEWHNNMGMALVRTGDKEQGLKHFKKAVIFAPNEPQFLLNLGNAHGMMGDLESSADVLERGIRSFPDSVQIKISLARTYINLKKYKKALKLLENIPVEERGAYGEIQILLNRAKECLNNQAGMKK